MNEESVSRIEPTLLQGPTGEIADVIAELSAAAATLGKALHPKTAASLAGLVRVMNTYYSNLIEGHVTRPREIELALAGQFDPDETRRNLQMEATAHIRVQAQLDRLAAKGTLPPPASRDFLRWLHVEFYRDAPEAMLTVGTDGKQFQMVPGEWRNQSGQDVAVGRHIPPSSSRVADFMLRFEEVFRLENKGRAARLMAMASAHHRFNYIHPFPDGNGRVSRLMSHAMAGVAGIGAHGLWSVSRGLARGLAPGLDGRREYMANMDHADAPRQGDRDGRGNLSEAALQDFVLWFLKVCLDQVTFMASLFDMDSLFHRLHKLAVDRYAMNPAAAQLLQEALMRGEFERGEISRITGMPERSARRVLGGLLDVGLLASDTPKGKLSLRFPADALDDLFPHLA